MNAGIFVSSLTFSDGSRVNLGATDILILTGPNNSGKSSALREISNLLHNDPASPGPVLREVTFQTLGSPERAFERILEMFPPARTLADTDTIRLPNGGAYLVQAVRSWATRIKGTPLSREFSHYLNTEGRLALCTPQSRQNLTQEPARNALSVLEIDSQLEDKISSVISDNFGFNLVLNRAGGSHTELRICRGELVHRREEYHTLPYFTWMNSLPTLMNQGDGVKSFTGILLALIGQPRPLILIDEPEAFLHPPQARAIAAQIARDASSDAQLIVATHSDEFIRGFLDAGPNRAKIVRIQREKAAEKEVNKATALDSQAIKVLWGDAILRTSDLLSGLFHQASVVVEGETDARFLRVMLDVVAEKKTAKVPDVKFHYGTGTGSIPKICSALRAVAVPTIVVIDPDVVASRDKLQAIVRSVDADFGEIADAVSALGRFLSRTSSVPTVAEMRAKVGLAFDGLEQASPFSRGVQTALRKIIDVDTPHDGLKARGRDYIVEQLSRSAGEAATTVHNALSAYDKIINWLKERGVLVYPDGELESFSRETMPKDGWLDRVLALDVANAPQLGVAREFAGDLAKLASSTITK